MFIGSKYPKKEINKIWKNNHAFVHIPDTLLNMLMGSGSSLAETSIRSTQKLVIFVIWKKTYLLQGIQKIFYLILKTVALLVGMIQDMIKHLTLLNENAAHHAGSHTLFALHHSPEQRLNSRLPRASEISPWPHPRNKATCSSNIIGNHKGCRISTCTAKTVIFLNALAVRYSNCFTAMIRVPGKKNR